MTAGASKSRLCQPGLGGGAALSAARTPRPGCPWQNGYAERFNGTVRDECLNSQAFVSVAEAQVLCAAYLREYNDERPHSSLGYQTPLEFKRDWYARQSLEDGL